MKKAGGKTLELKIGKLILITFIFFLLITTPTEKQSPVDEPSSIDDATPVNSSPEAERITYAPEVSHRGGKALYSLGSYDYQKRIQINVTNNMTEALSKDYSVSFSLNTWYLTNQGELQADGDDLRIAYNDSGSWVELNRVNGTAFNTYKTHIWFMTKKSIAANSYDANYWIYYGNPSVSDPPNNPKQVFLFFDDFNDENYWGWNITSGIWTVPEYPTSSGNYVVHGDNNDYLYKEPDLYGNVSISARIRWDGGDRRRGVSIRFDPSGTISYRLQTNSNENQIELRRQNITDTLINNTATFPSGTNYSAGDWYRYEIAAQTVNTNEVWVRGRIYDDNMTLRTELTYLDTSGSALYTTGQVALYGEGWFDDVIIRKFVNPEPTVKLNSPLGINLMLLTDDSTDPEGRARGDKYYKNITISSTQVPVDLTNFPLLIDLYDTDLHDDAQADGDDIRFQDAAGNPLDHEIEVYDPNYNPTQAHLVAWVCTNLSASSNTVISMYYGNPTVGNQQNPTGVWDSNYVAVWHFGEGSGTDLDSSTDTGDATLTQSDHWITGQVGTAYDFDGLDRASTDVSISGPTTGTLDFWFKPQSSDSSRPLGLHTDWELRYQGTDGALSFDIQGTGTFYTVKNSWISNQWYHITAVWDTTSDTWVIYVDASQDNSNSTILSDIQNSGILYFADSRNQGEYFDGAIDEIRISTVVRSADWIATQYDNQNDPASFYSVGNEQNITFTTDEYTTTPFYNHTVQNFGFVVDYHGVENKENKTAPFYLEGYDGILISAALDDDSWVANLGNVAIPILTWESGSYNELYLGETGFTLEETLRPNGRGNVDWLDRYGFGTTYNWECVDDPSPDSDITYVSETFSSWSKDTYRMENHLVGNVVIENVTIFIRCRENFGTAFAQTVIRTHSTDYEGAEISLTSSYQTYSTTYLTNPNTTAPWTWQEIDDLEIGVALRETAAGDGRCTQVYAIVKYSPDIAYTLPASEIKVVNNTHYITETIPSLGNYSIYSTSTSMGYMLNYTQLPSGSEISLLAQSADGNVSRGQLLALEKDAVDYNPPHIAAERRVFWPGHNGSALNPEGWELFDRALLWVLSADSFYAAPTIENGGSYELPSEDGLLHFWFNATDLFPGVNTTSGFVNITSQQYLSGIVYSMPYNGENFTIDAGLPYWATEFSERTEYNYTFTVSDLSGLSTAVSNVSNNNVRDIVAPSLVNHGVTYYPADNNATIWCIVSDGVNGSKIDTAAKSVNVSYNVLPMTWYGPFEMDWNGSSSRWEYNATGISGVDTFQYNFTARDRAYVYVDNSANPGYFDPGDANPPVINDFNHIYYGNGTVRFWANVTDAESNVILVVLKYNSTENPIPQQTVNMEYKGTLWVMNLDFPWNQTLSPYTINYTIARTRDESGNEFPPPPVAYKSVDIEDPVLPVITGADFEAVPDVHGHIRFWANISDSYSGLNLSRLSIKITLSNGTSDTYPMTHNGTLYTYDTSISYYDTAPPTRMAVTEYNVTAFDNANNWANETGGGPTTYVPDVVPPDLDTGVHDFQNGTITIWADSSDGIGAGIKNVTLDYLKNYVDPSSELMSWNGTFYTHTISGLQAGDIIAYNVTAWDNASPTNNSRAKLYNLYGVGDQTPPTIHAAGHEYVPSVDGRIRFYANVTEDIGGVKTVVVDGNVAESPFSGIMTFNQTYYTYEMNAYYGQLVSYNITASNYAGLTNQTTPVPFTVQDIVAPQTFSFQVINNQDGTIVFRATVRDGQFGSGIDSTKVKLIYQSYGSNWVTKSMAWDGTNYIYTLGNVFIGDVIKYYVSATDKVGNTGQSGLGTFPIIDLTNPIINKIGYDYLNDTDCHIRFWCFANDPFGILRTTNIKITGDQDEEGVMLWIGAYYYYDTFLEYENNFNFTVTVRDTAGNSATMSEFGHQVQDTVSPQTTSSGGEEFQNGTAVLWAIVEDGSFGSGFPPENNTVTITYRITAKFPETTLMTWNSEANRYEHVINGLSVNNVIDFAIDANDTAGNLGSSRVYTFIVPDTTPPQLTSFGYNLLPQEEGLVQFWASAEDSYGTIENVNLTINIISETSSTGKSATASKSAGSSLECEMVWNGTHYIHDENLGYQTMFSYTITIADGANLQAEGGASEQIVGDGAPPRVLDAGIIDPGDGKLTIWAVVEEKGTGIDSLEVVYSVDKGQTWQQAPMQLLNATHYKAKVQVEPGSPIQWTVTTKDLGGNANDAAWDVWLVTPYITATKGIPLTILIVIIAASGIIAAIAIRKFRKVVGLDKERVMAIADQMSDDDVIARLDDHTYGVILSFFDQREGPVPSIVTPVILDDHMQFLVDLSDRSFSAGGFVDETTEEKVTIFDTRLAESRMVCVSYAFAIDNPEARGGKENMTINLLIDPVYGELTNIFSPEILPSVRQIRSLVETKAPRLNISSHMDGLRSLVTRIIAAYQNLYGEDSTLEEGSVVTIEDA